MALAAAMLAHPMLVINTMVNIRGMSQHTFLEHQSDTNTWHRSILTNPVTASSCATKIITWSTIFIQHSLV